MPPGGVSEGGVRGWAGCEGGRGAGLDGGSSSIACWISSCTSREAFLNSLIPLPRPPINSGTFMIEGLENRKFGFTSEEKNRTYTLTILHRNGRSTAVEKKA